MPLKNRVTPWGEIAALPERGLFMGNRGCLHDANRRVIRPWARLPWVTCLLSFKGRHREVMAPGHYTELFFLDEATALAAGHRPCATCRRADYRLFKTYWLCANPDLAGPTDGAIDSIDRVLHAERVDGAGVKRTWTAALGELLDGTLVTYPGSLDPWLVFQRGLYPWTPGGYGPRRGTPLESPLQVLTPHSVVKVLALGYRPVLHPTLAGSSAPVRVTIKGVQASEGSATARATPAPSASSQLSDSLPAASRADAAGRLYRLAAPPAGKALFTYFAAILSVTGMDRGAVYPLNKFLRNFCGHLRSGRIERVPAGYRLTPTGRDYFADRFRPGNPKHVDRVAVEAVARLIRTGQAAGWVPVD